MINYNPAQHVYTITKLDLTFSSEEILSIYNAFESLQV